MRLKNQRFDVMGFSWLIGLINFVLYLLSANEDLDWRNHPEDEKCPPSAEHFQQRRRTKSEGEGLPDLKHVQIKQRAQTNAAQYPHHRNQNNNNTNNHNKSKHDNNKSGSHGNVSNSQSQKNPHTTNPKQQHSQEQQSQNKQKNRPNPPREHRKILRNKQHAHQHHQKQQKDAKEEEAHSKETDASKTSGEEAVCTNGDVAGEEKSTVPTVDEKPPKVNGCNDCKTSTSTGLTEVIAEDKNKNEIKTELKVDTNEQTVDKSKKENFTDSSVVAQPLEIAQES